jgi:hypothetical protein
VEELAGQGELAARTRLPGTSNTTLRRVRHSSRARSGPFLLGGRVLRLSTNFGETYHQLLQAFRDGGGVPQEPYGEQVAASIERFTAPWFEHMLVQLWLPEMREARAGDDAVRCRLRPGPGRDQARAGVPTLDVCGLRLYEPAILAAESNAHAARVADRTLFEVRDAAEGIGEVYDVITTFDIVHDSVDPGALLDPVVQGRRKSACAGGFGARLWLRDRRERAFARPVPGLRGGAPVGDHE